MAIRIWIAFVLAVVLAAVALIVPGAEAKDLRPPAERGENKIMIQADGLACYFCAYGMERFFVQSGRIAWYDMDMVAGVVEVGFVKGEPLPDLETLKAYVHDAGFSPREFRVELIGRLLREPDGSYRFEVGETAQRLPVETNRVVKEARGLIGREVTLMARAVEDPKAPMRLMPERFVPKGPEP